MISAEEQARIDALRALIAELGLTQREAAALAGINQRTMRRYCAGSETIPPWLSGRLRQRAKDARTHCPECEAYDRVHDERCPLHPEHDGAPKE
jgi:hypothetical protein